MFIQPLSRLEQTQTQEIVHLIPAPKTSAEQRRKINEYVRLRLSEISNLAVANLALMHGHQLSLRELRQRLGQHRFNLRELFIFAEMLCHQTSYRRAALILRRNTCEQIILLLPGTPADELLTLLLLYRVSRLCRDWNIIHFVLEHRTDADQLNCELSTW
ncbi:hypothetical protein KKF05_03730 [Patescibacteria group bacterium]|nr:hypothetical protein [Patescibacteria group bacterium]MBU1028955.1 hypothetical protein [Patescibacteria group bacterium]MBU1916388.1 hypothetical protein [Patescibacteria group bacterium]